MLRRQFRPVLPLLLLSALPALAQGSPRSIGECERLKNDLAYNQCLAMFGPPAKSVAGGDGSGAPPVQDFAPGAAAAAGIPSPEEPDLAEPGSRRRRGRFSYRHRQSASFAVATAGDEVAAESGASHRSRRRGRRHR